MDAGDAELTRTDVDALGGVDRIMHEITRRVSFGMGVPAVERVDHPVLDKIHNADFEPQRKLAQKGSSAVRWATTRSSSRESSPPRPRSRCSPPFTAPAAS